jgi:hypothetical protein
MLVEDGAEDLAIYTDASGRQIDRDAVDFFRLTWDAKDLAEYVNVLRSPHRESEDTLSAYEGLTDCLPRRDECRACSDDSANESLNRDRHGDRCRDEPEDSDGMRSPVSPLSSWFQIRHEI